MSAVGECIKLMGQSSWHSEMTVADLNRLLIPAMAHNRCLLWFDDDFVVTAFMTYAFLDHDAREGYGRGHLLSETDFQRPYRADTTPFVIDFVSPFGNVIQYVREAREFLGTTFGVKVWHWYRPEKGWQMGYALARSEHDAPRPI